MQYRIRAPHYGNDNSGRFICVVFAESVSAAEGQFPGVTVVASRIPAKEKKNRRKNTSTIERLVDAIGK